MTKHGPPAPIIVMENAPDISDCFGDVVEIAGKEKPDTEFKQSSGKGMRDKMNGTFTIEWTKKGKCLICDSFDTELGHCTHNWHIEDTDLPDKNLCWGPGEYPRPESVEEKNAKAAAWAELVQKMHNDGLHKYLTLPNGIIKFYSISDRDGTERLRYVRPNLTIVSSPEEYLSILMMGNHD